MATPQESPQKPRALTRRQSIGTTAKLQWMHGSGGGGGSKATGIGELMAAARKGDIFEVRSAAAAAACKPPMQ